MCAFIDNYPARETRQDHALPGSTSAQNIFKLSNTIEDQLRDVINTSVAANASEQVQDNPNGLNDKENRIPNQQKTLKSAGEDQRMRKELIKAVQSKISNGHTAVTTGDHLDDGDGMLIDSHRYAQSNP
jgi:hypothetical protein